MAPPRRKHANRDLSYVEANQGRLVTIENDVLEIQREIHERWPQLEVWLDTWHDPPHYVVVEHCVDGVDRLALERDYLDRRLIEAIEKADSARGDSRDPLDIMRELEDDYERRQDARWEQLMGDAGERLLFALKQDGIDAGVKKVFT